MFAPDRVNEYIENGDRTTLITSSTPPTLNIAREAFGTATIKLFLKQHLWQLAKYYGFASSTNEEQIDEIANVLSLKAGDLKTTELMLFFQMLKEGHFRDRNDDDRAKMFGSLNGEVILDCFHKFKFDYRDAVINRHNGEMQMKEKDESFARAATPYEKKEMFFEKCLAEPSFFDLIRECRLEDEIFIKNMGKAIDEFKALRLLKKCCEEYLQGLSEGKDPNTTSQRIANGVKYLNEHFPTTKNNEQ